MPKLSVIVPVYNVEKYIDKCLNSLVNQTLDDMEIVIVNDGSKDKSKDIINKYIQRYSDKIKYYSNPYDSAVEIVLLNTCGFISSGREEMFQTINKTLKKKKKICLIGC